MPSIGPYTVTGWRGNMPRATRAMISLPAFSGVVGNVVVRGVKRVPNALITTAVDVSSSAAADALYDNYIGMVGDDRTYQVYDQRGRGYPNVIIIGCTPQIDMILASLYRVTTQWQFDVPIT
jgi:hypothetical protein